MRALVRLMTVPEDKRDGRWLEEGLQAAIQLEMSTIPPYLYAAWSIDESADPSGTREVILQIAREEMLHMGIACNLLAAIGGQPRIVQVAPSYPTRLPKDIHQGLAVALEPLSRELLLNTFNYLDLTPSGRPYHVGEVPHHDRYGDDHPETNIAFLLAGGGAPTTE